MKIQIKMPAWSHVRAVALYPCAGSISHEGWRRDCFDDCVAHFDAWADGGSEYGDRSQAYSPYPNAHLISVGLMPGTTAVDSWIGVRQYREHRQIQAVVLLQVPDLFRDEDGNDLSTWVVVCEDDSTGNLTAHLTLTEAAARDLMAAAIADMS